MTRISDSHSLMTHEKQGSMEENKRKIQEDVASLVNLLGHRFNHIIVSYFMA